MGITKPSGNWHLFSRRMLFCRSLSLSPLELINTFLPTQIIIIIKQRKGKKLSFFVIYTVSTNVYFLERKRGKKFFLSPFCYWTLNKSWLRPGSCSIEAGVEGGAGGGSHAWLSKQLQCSSWARCWSFDRVLYKNPRYFGITERKYINLDEIPRDRHCKG